VKSPNAGHDDPADLPSTSDLAEGARSAVLHRMTDPIALAALAEVGIPASPTSEGALYLLRVAQGLAEDLAAVGRGVHAGFIPHAADVAVPLADEDAFAAFVDLGLWSEGLATVDALEAAGRRLGAAIVAQATVVAPTTAAT
jgi:hypothetical protein